MSIKIGNTVSYTNASTKERISLESASDSNLIIMRSLYNDVNISLFSGGTNDNLTFGKSGDSFKITGNNSIIASLSLFCNIFNGPTYLNNSVTIGQSINIANTVKSAKIDTTSINITPSLIAASNIYLLASNINGKFISASTSGFVNIIGNVNIGNVSSNPQYSLMVDKNVNIGNILNVPTILTSNITSRNISNNRITGLNATGRSTNSYIDFGNIPTNQTTYFEFNSNSPYWYKVGTFPSTWLQGSLTVSDTVYTNKLITNVAATFINVFEVTSNLTTATLNMKNLKELNQPTILINHTDYNNNDIIDINLITNTSNLDTGCNITNSIHAFTIDHVGRAKFGAVLDTNSLFSIQSTVNNYNNTANLFTLLGYDTSNSIVYINNTGDVGIGTTSPVNRMHIVQCIGDVSSNNPLIGLYAFTNNTSNYDTGESSIIMSDLIVGYSNNTIVYYVNSSGDIIGNSFTTSNFVSAATLNVSTISANNYNNKIDYTTSSISNINIIDANTINSSNINNIYSLQTSNINTNTLNTVNLFIPNLKIFNDEGYYAVYTQQLWFTGSNIVMSSLESDRLADASQGKLVVRTDDQKIITGNAIGLNAIGTQASSIRVTSSQQPNYELFGPDTTSYIGATKSTNASGANMFYISHVLGNNVADNPSNARIKIYAYNNNIGEGTVIDDLMYINFGKNQKIGIGISGTNITDTLHIRGSFLVENTANYPILYGKLNESYNTYGNEKSIQVGVGTTIPICQLDILGSVWARNSQSGIPGNIYADGTVGIGTTSPSAKLHVEGISFFTSNVGIGIQSAGYSLNVNGNTNISQNLYVGTNIGIGTTNPRFNLDVRGTANFNSNVFISNLSVSNLTTNTILQINTTGTAGTVTNGIQPNITLLNNPALKVTYLEATNAIVGNITGAAETVRNPTQNSIVDVPNIQTISTGGSNITIGSTNSKTFVLGVLTSSNIRASNVVANYFTGSLIGSLIGTASNAYLANIVTNITQSNIINLPNVQNIGYNSKNITIGASNVLTTILGTTVIRNLLILTQSSNIEGTIFTPEQPNITSVGTLTSLNVATYINSSNLFATYINASNVTATNFTGALIGTASNAQFASTVTNPSQPYITSVGTLDSLNINSSIYASNIVANYFIGNVIGNITNALFANTVTNSSQPNITSVGTLDSLNVTTSISASNVVANYFTGTLIGNASNALLATTVTNSNQPYITSVGTLRSLNVTSNISASNVVANYFTGTLIGNASNALLANTVTNSNQPYITSVGTLRSLNVTSNITASNVVANYFTGTLIGNASNALTANTVINPSQPNITSVGTLTNLNVSGILNTSNFVVLGTTTINSVVTENSNLIINNLNGPGSALSVNQTSDYGTSTIIAEFNEINNNNSISTFCILAGGTVGINNNNPVYALDVNGTINSSTNINTTYTVNASNVVANYFTGSLLGNASSASTANIVTDANQPYITSVGTLNSLNISSIIYTSNVVANYFTGYLIGSSSNATLASTVTNASQPRITSVGTLVSLNVTSNITASNVVANYFTGTLIGNASNAILANTVTNSNQPYITSVGRLVSLNVTSNITASTFTGLLTSPIQSNITSVGTLKTLNVTSNINASNVVANYFTGTLIGTASNALLAGTVTNASQPYITSLGTLNFLTANNIFGTINTSSQPNITSLGILNSLSVTGTINTSNIVSNYFNGTLIGNASTASNLLGNIPTTQISNLSGAVSNLIAASIVGGINASQVTGLSSLYATSNYVTTQISKSLAPYAPSNYVTSQIANSINTSLASSNYVNTQIITALAPYATSNYVTSQIANISISGSGITSTSIITSNIVASNIVTKYISGYLIGTASNATFANTVLNSTQSNITFLPNITNIGSSNVINLTIGSAITTTRFLGTSIFSRTSNITSNITIITQTSTNINATNLFATNINSCNLLANYLTVVGGNYGSNYSRTIYGAQTSNIAVNIPTTLISIYAQNAIWTGTSIISSSDNRIKKNINDITNNYGLEKIRQIQPRTYNFIDNIAYGNNLVYGFVAQETSNVIPECISLQSHFIPNIYTTGICTNRNITLINKTTKCIDITNTKIKLITENNNEVTVTLNNISDTYNFTIKEDIPHKNIFVYGQYIEDFHVLEKDVIFTLTTAAVKALDDENKKLKIKISDLDEKQIELMATINDFDETQHILLKTINNFDKTQNELIKTINDLKERVNILEQK